MSKYFAELQTPVVELIIEMVSANNRKASIEVGFKQYNSDETKEWLDKYYEISKESRDIYARTQDKYEGRRVVDGVVVDSGVLISKGEEIDKSITDTVDAKLTKDTIAFIKDNVSYIKKIKLNDAEGNELLFIKDTRTFDKKEIWEGEGFSTCLDFVMSLYMPFTPWRTAFINGVFSALTNTPASKKAAVKN